VERVIGEWLMVIGLLVIGLKVIGAGDEDMWVSQRNGMAIHGNGMSQQRNGMAQQGNAYA